MNIFVCIKQVPSTETKIKINANGTGIDTTDIKWIMSPYDEIAVEEALRAKEKSGGAGTPSDDQCVAPPTVTVISVGPPRVTETIRTALAMGCDNAIHIEAPEDIDSFMVALALSAVIKKAGHKKDGADLVFSGKQAVDDDCAQVGPLLATFLDIPYVTVVLSADYGANNSSTSITVKREIEGGVLEVIEIQKPCLIAPQKGMNEPRFASLPNIMKARKKEIKNYSLADLGVSEADRKIKVIKLELPPPKQAGKKIDGDAKAQAAALVKALREEAKIF